MKFSRQERPGWTILILIISLISGCGGDDSGARGSENAPGDFRNPFDDVTAESGLDNFRHQTGAVGRKWMPETLGSGVGFIDYDHDGHLDIVLVGGGVWPGDSNQHVPVLRLYRNSGDGFFREVTREAGLYAHTAYGFGVTVADVDNDGDDDLYTTTLHRNLFFLNDGGRFAEVAEEAGVAGADEWSTCSIFFDADRDGHLDLYVCNYVDWSPENDVYCDLGGSKAYCAPEDYRGVAGRYFHNDGDGTFTERTAEAGFVSSPAKSLGVVEADFNRDGWPDLVVANDAEPNLFYENDGDGTFSEKAILAGIAFDDRGRARGGMGVDAGDVDGDGRHSVFIGNFSEQAIGVFRQADSALFVDRAAASRIAYPSYLTLTFGLFLMDVDFDTDLDLFAANGHIQEQIQLRHDNVSYRQRPQLFLNGGDGTFTEAPPKGVFADSLIARGAAFGDVDEDGDPDILLSENGGGAHLWRNEINTKNFVRVELEGRASNRGGVGSRITAWVGSTRMERRIHTGGSYLSASEQVATFGLGRAAGADSLRIEWPSGRIDRLGRIEQGQTIRLTEGRGITGRAS